MCGMCPDVYGSCAEVECGAFPRLREDGSPRARYMRHYTYGEVACVHVAAEHHDDCPVPKGGGGCLGEACWDQPLPTEDQ